MKYESQIIKDGESGDFFYTPKKDAIITAMAVYYNKKVKTKRMIAVSTLDKEVDNIIKVTIL